MRRSVREALVGFSLLAAVVSGLGLWFWLKGVTLSRGNWTMVASFKDAAGLATRSPVYYRGVMVGRVSGIKVSGEEVIARLEITDADLRLARPLVARVGAGSLLGGDAVVSLLSGGNPLPRQSPSARDRSCDNQRMVCDGGKVRGVEAPTLESVTATVQGLLEQVDQERLVKRLVRATDSFDKTAEEIRRLSAHGETFVDNADQLVTGLTGVVGKTDPIVNNLQAASLDARQASQSVKRLSARLDNPQVVGDLQATMANARRLTERWEAVGNDVQKLTGDPTFVEGMRRVSVGLGRFFEDLYPGAGATSPAAAHRTQGLPAPRASAPATQAVQSPLREGHPIPVPMGREPGERMAPRSKDPATPVPATGFGAVPP
jgi:phospholipid/cholesterol/gamma-HCH transport system substrate-binding protein